MQQFHKFITRRSCVARRVSGASSPIIRSLQLHQQPLVLPLKHGGSCYRHASTVKPEAANAVLSS